MLFFRDFIGIFSKSVLFGGLQKHLPRGNSILAALLGLLIVEKYVSNITTIYYLNLNVYISLLRNGTGDPTLFFVYY